MISAEQSLAVVESAFVVVVVVVVPVVLVPDDGRRKRVEVGSRRRLPRSWVISTDSSVPVSQDSVWLCLERVSFGDAASCLGDGFVPRRACAPGFRLSRFELAFLRLFFHTTDAHAVDEQSTPSQNHTAYHNSAKHTYYAAKEHVEEW